MAPAGQPESPAMRRHGRSAASMRGFFAVGVEGISKQMNTGSLMRCAHAFGASFVFTIGARYRPRDAASDTSQLTNHVPLYQWDTIDGIALPAGCALVGVELIDEAVDLPSFRHPLRAAYVLGPERGAVSPELLARCDHVIKIPTSFCINLAIAGAIVMYDRVMTLGRFAPRPVASGAPTEDVMQHVHGRPLNRSAD